MYLIGYDIGSSSIKVALATADTGALVDVIHYPEEEMEISSPQPDWAEQDPDKWWEYAGLATKKLLANNSDIAASDICAIGISYQMHGLVIVDENRKLLRPSIIWCDSRAVAIGNEAFEQIGETKCLSNLLNSPGNFTASKLKWVKENEPTAYNNTYKFMLPGDYLGMKMTDDIYTTISGLSEGIFWDFKDNAVADFLLEHYGIDSQLIPDIAPTCGDQGKLTASAAAHLGLVEGTPLTYRAGDQPNNALSLNVLEKGDIAATGGTSGVVYGVTDEPLYDPQSRVNGFAHVNHTINDPKIGILLCINGAGIQYSWIKKYIAEENLSYFDMESMASKAPINADGLQMIPFGNGAERILNNQNIGAHMLHLNFNRHNKSHIFRAALEGIAFSFVYGVETLINMGIEVKTMKVGNDNLFQSNIFSQTIANALDCHIEMIETTGALGAARASGIATGHFKSLRDANQQLNVVGTTAPDADSQLHVEGYQKWKNELENLLK